MTNIQQHWDESHVRYSQQEWIDKPSKFAEEILSYLPPKSQLLELAAGQGQDSRFFATHGFKVVCTDFSPKALEIASDKAQKAGLYIQTVELPLLSTFPFEDASFDVVYSHLGLQYFCKDDTLSIIKEIHRVLKPNGIMCLLLNTVLDPEIQEFGYEEVEPHFYQHLETGVCKSYFSAPYLSELTAGLFEPIVLDEKGHSYKDQNTNLVRFVGKKI